MGNFPADALQIFCIGSGKTLHMISMLMHKKDLQGRALYIDGIPDVDLVKIPYEMLPENCTGENWQANSAAGLAKLLDWLQCRGID